MLKREKQVLNSDNLKESVLRKILESDSFKGRDLYQKLLKYLVKASCNGATPKEMTIAYDVFNKGKDFNAAEDTTVRVHIHNLRKRLEQYYQSEGQSDKIKLYIPKGHYLVKFAKNIKSESHPLKSHKNILSVLLIFILCLAIFCIIINKYFVSKSNQCFEVIDRNDAIWGRFFRNKYPTSVVIGDFLVFHETDNQLNRSRRIQDYQINTVEELNAYIENNPAKNIESWFLGELPHNSIFNIVDIQPVFLSFKQEMEINFTTEIDINFIKNRNIIYIGEFKNLRALSDLLSFLPVKYETLPWWHGAISYQVDDSLITLKTFHDWGISRYVVDIALVAKLPGQNNENYLIIAGFGYNSQIKIVKLFSQKSSLRDLEDNIKAIHGYVPEYFTIVFEVTGFDRASTTAELKYFQEVKRDFYQKYLPPFSK